MVTEVMVCKQVIQYLVPDKAARGVKLYTICLALNASAKSASLLAVFRQSHHYTLTWGEQIHLDTLT